MATGKVIGKCDRRHRGHEFLKFLEEVDAATPREESVRIHLVLDNYATRKTPAVQRWFLRHPEYHLHFTPRSRSWLNQVERFFAAITEQRVRRGVFRSVLALGSVLALRRAIRDYLENHNANAKPFVWTGSTEMILERIEKVIERTSDSGHYTVPSISVR